MQVSRSGYYAWRKQVASQQKMANQALVEEIKVAYQDSNATYGSPRIYKELKESGVKCSENRVARLMRAEGIRAKQVKRFKVTTKTNPAHPVAPNLLGRDFSAKAPDQKWTADISYISTVQGWLYLAIVLDLFSRRVVGCAMSSRMTTSLVTDALKMAIRQRQPQPGLLHHSDRGSQYTGQPYRTLLADHLMVASMSRTGNCYDNAPTESFFGTLKTELVNHRRYETRAEAKTDIFFYIEGFYNRKRRHSTLDYLSPEAFEATFHDQQSVLTLCP